MKFFTSKEASQKSAIGWGKRSGCEQVRATLIGAQQ